MGAGRRAMFEINLASVKLGDGVKLTDGYSGADVASVCRDAAMMGLRVFLSKARAEGLTPEQIKAKKEELDVPIQPQDFREAVKNCSKSVGTEDLQNFAE